MPHYSTHSAFIRASPTQLTSTPPNGGIFYEKSQRKSAGFEVPSGWDMNENTDMSAFKA